MTPQYRQQKRVNAEIEEIGKQLGSIDNQLLTLAEQLDGSTEASLERRIADLRKQIGQATGREKRMMSRFIPPEKMASVLQDLLQTNSTLRLLKLESLGSEPLQDNHRDKETVQVYQHGVRMVFEGNFFAIMDYLKSIESLPWKLYWDQIDYAVSDYPYAEVSITVHTLSLKKEWIGV